MTQPIPEGLTWHQDGYGDSPRHSGEIDARFGDGGENIGKDKVDARYGDDHYPLSNATPDELRWLQEQADRGGDYAASKVIDNERYRRAEALREEMQRR